MASLLSIRSVAKSFGKNPVLRNISLEIAEGEFLTILGESGSGKTTLLRIIAGFESADSGEILMAGERFDGIAAIPAPRQHCFPELRTVPAPNSATECRLWITGCQST